MTELDGQAVHAGEATVAEEAPVEDWIVMTQSTLGRFVEKPRLMADRLRKPPFRFLFDVAVEVARQTGFGVSELFQGTLSAKPQAPGSREEKVQFIVQWVHLVQWALGPPTSGHLVSVNPTNVICGMYPEWTNYLLQCTAAAAWPNDCTSSRPATQAAKVTVVGGVEIGSVEVPVADTAPVETAVQEVSPAVDPAAEVAIAETSVPTGVDASAPEQEPVDLLQPDMTVEQAREIAAGMDFSATMNHFNSLHQEFTSTAQQWNVDPTIEAQPDAQMASQEDIDVPAPQDGAPEESVARVPLKQAQVRVGRVDEELNRAEDLLNQIEEGFDRTTVEMQQKRQMAEEKKLREQAEAEALEREAAEQEAAAALEQERLKEEKAARKAAKKAEKERLAAEEAARPVYPMSKLSAGQGARIVSCVGDDDDDEYEWDGDEEDAAEQQQNPEEELPEADSPLTGAAGFDLSAALGDDPRGPAPTLGFAIGASAADHASSLFDKLKTQLKDTFVSYLCASMPESLLKKYQGMELVCCLQLLLTELRKCIAQHSLEDVDDEEPTTLAEGLKQKFPNDWVVYLQGGTPSVFCHQYDVPELIDTLQSLSQICLERLEDNLGPLQSWLEESSPLRYIPPAEPFRVDVDTPPAFETGDERFGTTSNSGGLSDPCSPTQLPPAPWEPVPVVAAPAVPAASTRGAGMASTFADFRHRSVSPTPAASRPPPTFDSTLGPAPWEQDGPINFPATAAGPHAASRALHTAAPGGRALHTGAPGGRALNTAAPQPGMPHHPATSHAVPRTYHGNHVVASR